jgi:hypothetical protein
MNQELENVSNEPMEEITPMVNEPQMEVTETFHVAELIDEENELDVVEELPDYSLFSKEDLLKAALEAAASKQIGEALLVFKTIRPFLEQQISEEKAEALAKFIEEGGEKDSFEFKADANKEAFNKAFQELKLKKEDAKRRQEEEKKENLRKKEAILEEIKKLNDSEETANSIKRLKELQAEWKLIKNVPKENIDSLWESYRVLIEIFYDRLSINNELKELDRSKNLGLKIELISKVNELLSEPNIKKALIGAKKLQEEWRYIGPVDREASEDIWNRFKTEVDKVYAQIKEKTEALESVRQENLAKKQELLLKAKEMADFKTTRIKDWMEQSLAANELMEAWRKIGHVPMSVRDQVWNEFREARNSFFNNKNVFFKSMHAERNANLKAKEELCVRAETIAANPIDWAKLTEEIKKLQEDWKKIGMAPEKVNDAVWKRFRSACDSFFEKKSERYASQQQEQIQNLEAKSALIEKLEALSNSEQENNLFNELRQIQSEWNGIGYVPAKNKDAITKKYNELLDKLYGKNKQLNKDSREDREKQNFEFLANSPNGSQKLQREEKVLMERIRGLKKDIETWDNNLGFFKGGNQKNPLAEQILAKIEIAHKHIAGLEEKVKMLRDIKNKPADTIES